MHQPDREERLPPIDERLIYPDARAEIIEGQLRLAPPADQAHSRHHTQLSAVLQAYTQVREMLLAVSAARGLLLDEPTRAKIASCEDLDALRRWTARRSGGAGHRGGRGAHVEVTR
jgi:hypothetical protein